MVTAKLSMIPTEEQEGSKKISRRGTRKNPANKCRINFLRIFLEVMCYRSFVFLGEL